MLHIYIRPGINRCCQIVPVLRFYFIFLFFNITIYIRHVISTMKGEFSLQLQTTKLTSFQNNDEGNDATTGEIETASRPSEDDVDHLRPILNTY